MHEFMNMAIEESAYNKSNDYQFGGPFGAVIVKDGVVIARDHNRVIENKDATAHAEINVIRKASCVLGTHDLSGCILYTSCEPCPMCLSAILWANIKEVNYANTKEDAAKIGFRDNFIYDYFKNLNQDNCVKLIKVDNLLAKEVFDDYFNNVKKYHY